MFVIRQATLEDASTLLKLAKMVHFINLPPDTDIIGDQDRPVATELRRAGRFGQRPSVHVRARGHGDGATSSGRRRSRPASAGPDIRTSTCQVRRRELFSDDLQTGAGARDLAAGNGRERTERDRRPHSRPFVPRPSHRLGGTAQPDSVPLHRTAPRVVLRRHHRGDDGSRSRPTAAICCGSTSGGGSSTSSTPRPTASARTPRSSSRRSFRRTRSTRRCCPRSLAISSGRSGRRPSPRRPCSSVSDSRTPVTSIRSTADRTWRR